jgi:toxin ParE1/3/4
VRLEFTDAAESDLADVYAFYAARSGPTANDVLGTILHAINGLALFPLMGKPGEVPETRERLLGRYPYRIVYPIDRRTEVIEIWRVLHTSRQWTPEGHAE